MQFRVGVIIVVVFCVVASVLPTLSEGSRAGGVVFDFGRLEGRGVVGAQPAGEPTEYPIVLAHGFAASDSGKRSFYKVAEALREDGHTVLEAEVPPYQHQSVRAQYLAETVRKAVQRSSSDQVNIVAHSMGGLDARYLASELPASDHVASITTIATPHRGTRLADIYRDFVGGEPSEKLVDPLAGTWGMTYNEFANETDIQRAMKGLSPNYLSETFNHEIRNEPDIYYQSWAGVSNFTGTPPANLSDVCEGKVQHIDGHIDELSSLFYPTAPLVPGESNDIHDGRVGAFSRLLARRPQRFDRSNRGRRSQRQRLRSHPILSKRRL